MYLPRYFGLGIALLSTAGMAQTPISLDQAMAHPDWIGTPIESAWWSADSQSVFYRQKLIGSPVRATYTLSGQDGNSARARKQRLDATR